MMNRKIIFALAALVLTALTVWYFLPKKETSPSLQGKQELQGDPQNAEAFYSRVALDKGDITNSVDQYLRSLDKDLTVTSFKHISL